MQKRFLLMMMILTISNCAFPLQVSAKDNANSQIIIQAECNNEVSVNTSDIIEYKYRVNAEGKLQYRRWNATKGYWIDATWLNAN